MKFTPHEYQQYCIDRILQIPKVGLFLEMGLGKTVITLTAIHELKYNRWSVGRALVIAPKKVAEATWYKESTKWDHLEDVRVVMVLGSAAERIKALQADADVYVINRDNVQWLVAYYNSTRRDRRWPFDMVVIDESSSFKNHQAKRFRALKTVLPRINRMIELTGTPAPHGLMDLWAQVYLLDEGKRLGRTISVYRDLFFLPDKRNAQVVYSYKLKQGAAEAIHNAISDICVSMRAEDYLTLPDCVTEEIPVMLDKKAKSDYLRMERDMLLTLTDENDKGERIITASSAGVLTNKLLQLCDGAVYDEQGEAAVLHDCKLTAFLETVEQLNGQHALVFYNFQHDRARLMEALKKAFPSLRVRVYSGPQDEEDWNGGKIDLLLAHPASCAYGLNLQNGGYHVIWFGLTWSLELYQQANKRLHRQGQQHPVIIHHLVVQGGVDEDVMRSLTLKDKDQSILLRALNARVERIKGAV